MKKNGAGRKILRIVLIVLAAAVIGTAMFYFIRGMIRKNYGTPTGYSHSRGGDMQGSRHTVSVWAEDDGTATVSIASKEWHYMDLTVAEYRVDSSLFGEIGKVVDEYGLYRFPDLPKSPVRVLDAASSSWYFSFDSGKDYSFGDGLIIPKRGYEGLEKIDGLIRDAANAGEKLPGLVLPETGDEPPERYTEGKVTLSVAEYMSNTLTYRIGNGLDEEVSIDEDVHLFDADGTEIYSYESKYPITVYPEHYTEEEIELKCPRLTAGTYRLTVGTLETEFEIR